MQDWSMIPIHIRCTERWKINPNFPEDACKFWKLSENLSKRMGKERAKPPYGGVPGVVLEYASTIRGDVFSLQNLAGTCKVPVEAINSGVKAVRRGYVLGSKQLSYPYEEMSETEIRGDKWLQENL
jgi:hypothetical protein